MELNGTWVFFCEIKTNIKPKLKQTESNIIFDWNTFWGVVDEKKNAIMFAHLYHFTAHHCLRKSNKKLHIGAISAELPLQQINYDI